MARSPLHRRGGEPQGRGYVSAGGGRRSSVEAEHRQASGPRVHSQAHLVPVVGLEVEVRATPELAARPSRQEGPMRVLLVHPSPLLFSEIYLRLEPLGVERVGAALAAAGHEVRLLDLQVWRHGDYRRTLRSWRPEVIGFSLNYLANVPEVVDLAGEAKDVLPDCRVLVGGHSASFVAAELLAHADGAIDCVVRGEGEAVAPHVLEAFAGGPPLASLPGVTTSDGGGAAAP